MSSWAADPERAAVVEEGTTIPVGGFAPDLGEYFPTSDDESSILEIPYEYDIYNFVEYILQTLVNEGMEASLEKFKFNIKFNGTSGIFAPLVLVDTSNRDDYRIVMDLREQVGGVEKELPPNYFTIGWGERGADKKIIFHYLDPHPKAGHPVIFDNSDSKLKNLHWIITKTSYHNNQVIILRNKRPEMNSAAAHAFVASERAAAGEVAKSAAAAGHALYEERRALLKLQRKAEVLKHVANLAQADARLGGAAAWPRAAAAIRNAEIAASDYYRASARGGRRTRRKQRKNRRKNNKTRGRK